jgi:L-glyceraldehyde 3-phosphate reductase
VLTEQNLEHVRALNQIARERGQTLAQMAIAWVLRKPAVTSALIGASRWSQIEECLGALSNLRFSDEELARIERHALEGHLNIWADSSRHG